jgi:formylglycine-generating enzyme required for sulfatase activity
MKSVPQEQAEKRVALVIGNGAYKESPLRNPVNDARAMASTLKSLGFKVLTGENLNQKEMKRIVRDFGEQIKSSGVGLFYYAGHGISSNGRNYLIPIGADISKEQDIDLEAVDAQYALAEMEVAQNRMNIVILDACRNNPFGRSFRSANRGLAQMTAPTGTFIAYSTAPGSLAADGDGSNGLYTEELVRQIKAPGAKLEDVFKKVLSNVKQASAGKQVPWTASSVEGEFFFSQSSTEDNLPDKPKAGNFNLADLNAAAKKEEDVKNAWTSTLKEMQTAYTDVTAYEKRDVSADLKKAAWSRFLTTYSEDNPYSTEDNTIRNKAQTQLAYWGTVKTPISRPVGKVKSTDLPSISNSIGMELVLVQPGTFQMGSDDGEADEKPIHSVTISKPFYIGKYEVTQKQWRDVMGTNPSKYQGDNRPVESVSWNDAQDFIRKLNEKEGTTKYRLPTEAEWEFAARGSTQSNGYKFAGSSNVADVAVYTEDSGGETKPVGTKRPNELGIYDMSGNVWEWCSDWKGDYSGSAERDPKGPTSGMARVLRGGSFGDFVNYCRVAFRYGNVPNYRSDYLGFRCVREVD